LWLTTKDVEGEPLPEWNTAKIDSISYQEGLKAEYELKELAKVKTYQVQNDEQIEIIEYIHSLWKEEADLAVKVARCESNLRTDVISRTSDVGVFQINLAAHGHKIAPTRAEQIEWLQDYKNNIDFAYSLWQKSRWVPWVCYTKKLY